MLIGAISGVLVCLAVFFIEGTLKVDDPVGAISVHGVNGAWGVLSLGLFADGKYGDGWNGVPGTVTGPLLRRRQAVLRPVHRHADLLRLRLRSLLRLLQGPGRDHRQPRLGRSRDRRPRPAGDGRARPIPEFEIVARAHEGGVERAGGRAAGEPPKPAARRGHGAPPRCPVERTIGVGRIMTRVQTRGVETPASLAAAAAVAMARRGTRPDARADAGPDARAVAHAPSRPRSTSPASWTSTTATTSTRSIPSLRTFDVQHNTFSLSLAEVELHQGRHPGEQGRLPRGPRLRQDRRPRGGLRAGERRQGDLQAHPAGLRQPAHGQGAVGRRQVRDPHRGRGDRVPGQLELHSLDPLRLRDPLLPRRRAGHAHRQRPSSRWPATS